MATYRNINPEDALFERVKSYISGLGYYIKPPGGIPASDLANYVLPSAVTDYSVGRLNYTKNLGTVIAIKMNNAVVPQTEGVVDLGAVQEKIDADHKLSGDSIIDGLVNKVINIKPDWNAASGNDAEILNKPTIPAAQIQSDWNQSTTAALDYIKNKPTIPTVPTNVSAFNNDAGYLTSHQDISGKENTSNKVTSLSSSSTDTQYPSAKCVWDLVGDIETILASI